VKLIAFVPSGLRLCFNQFIPYSQKCFISLKAKFNLFMPFDIVTYLLFWYFVVLEQNMCFSLKMVPGIGGSSVVDA